MNKLLTIGIPTFNRKTALLKTIDNFLNQVITNNLQDIVEIVVSDNASNDGTFECLKEIQNKYSDFIVINSNNENVGFGRNLCKIFEISNSKYVWTCSDDDKYYDDSLITLINTIKKYNNIGYIYLSSKQSNIKNNGLETLYNFILRGGMCSACISSNVFSKEMIKAYHPKSMTWLHMDLIFNSNLNLNCITLEKQFSNDMPDEHDPTYWYNKADVVFDYDTEIIDVIKKSKLPSNIKKVLYNHYKNCLPNEIHNYLKSKKTTKSLVFKGIKRLYPILYFRKEIVKLFYFYLTKF